MIKRFLLAACTTAVTLGGATGMAVADFAHTAKVNISGQQRMLSQRMARAVCFKAIEVDIDRHVTMARYAISDFELNLAALNDGDWSRGIKAESNPEVLEAMAAMEGLWGPFHFALKRAVDDPEALSRVA